MVYLETEIWDMVVGAAEFQTHHVSFAELLPSMNLKFNLRDDLIARFAWGKVMSQPSFDHLNPGGQKHAGQKLVTEGDPTLLPYIAEQVDIGIE